MTPMQIVGSCVGVLFAFWMTAAVGAWLYFRGTLKASPFPTLNKPVEKPDMPKKLQLPKVKP